MKKLKKVIIPVAGLGTRMLPATKVIPKEMLPLAGKPIIQHIVEEIKEAGFKEIILVTHPSKASIEKHFDATSEVEAVLDKKLEKSFLKEIKDISKIGISIQSIRQDKARGLGHAILVAKKLISNEPFAIVLPDMLIHNYRKEKNLSLMKRDFEKNNISSILFSKAEEKEISNYGIAKIRSDRNYPGMGILDSMVEKPTPENAPSNLFAVGRYIFTPEIFKNLSNIKPGKNREIELTDAIDSFIKENRKVCAYELDGKVYDCGNKLGYLIANIEFSKNDPKIGYLLKKYLKNNA